MPGDVNNDMMKRKCNLIIMELPKRARSLSPKE
jgi:hypothetical protein